MRALRASRSRAGCSLPETSLPRRVARCTRPGHSRTTLAGREHRRDPASTAGRAPALWRARASWPSASTTTAWRRAARPNDPSTHHDVAADRRSSATSAETAPSARPSRGTRQRREGTAARRAGARHGRRHGHRSQRRRPMRSGRRARWRRRRGIPPIRSRA